MYPYKTCIVDLMKFFDGSQADLLQVKPAHGSALSILVLEIFDLVCAERYLDAVIKSDGENLLVQRIFIFTDKTGLNF